MTAAKFEKAQDELAKLRVQYAGFLRQAEQVMAAIRAASGVLSGGEDARVVTIMHIVAEDYLVPVEEMVAPTRGSLKASEARIVAMVLCRLVLRMSTLAVGVEFRRHHGSVLWAEKRVDDLRGVEKAFAERFERLRAAGLAAVERMAA